MALADQYEKALKALLPNGLIWEKSKNNAVLKIRAEMMANVHSVLDNLVKESNVKTSADLLSGWAEAYGLYIDGMTQSEAQNALSVKRNAKGGCSASYFEQLCRSFGINQPKITECVPFMCGLSECGSADMCGDEDIAYMWFVQTPANSQTLKDFLMKYKPSHSCLFFESEA